MGLKASDGIKKIEGNYVGDEHHSKEDGSITLKYMVNMTHR